jgi:hypothetical protein
MQYIVLITPDGTMLCSRHHYDFVMHNGATYKDIMNEFGISSKGTLSFIINKSLAGGGNWQTRPPVSGVKVTK